MHRAHSDRRPPKPYRRAVVLGLGRSGLAAARLLAAEGTVVTAADQKDSPDLRGQAEALRDEGVTVTLAATACPDSTAEVVVISPGIPRNSAWLAAMTPAGATVISELELGASRCRCPILAITGSNGKSTLTKLCTEAIQHAGLRAACGGNYGIPLADLAPQSGAMDWLVVEVSSFQLEAVDTLRPRVAVLLNIQPNHFDRHGDLETYTALKCRLFHRQGEGDTAVVLADIAASTRARVDAMRAAAGGPRWVTFGAGPASGYRYEPGLVRGPSADALALDLRGTRFDNPVIGPAAAAAAAALRAIGIDAVAIQNALRRYEPLPHRMNDLGSIRGVRFINDSKATTLAALRAGVAMAGGQVRLIAGGLLKESDLTDVEEILAKQSSAVYLIGKAAPLMERAWSPVVACRSCGTLEQAVRTAWGESIPGDTILLSPGCASFDQFRSFEDRGEQFVSSVRRIREEAGDEDVDAG